MKTKIIIIIITIVSLCLASGCKDITREDDTGEHFLQEEETFRATFQQTGINAEGTVLDENGNAVANALLQLGDLQATTDAAGRFHFSGINRVNRLLTITAQGFRKEILPIYLNHPLSETTAQLPPIYLPRLEAGEVRFLFAGDTSFARRFLDPLDLTPRDQMPPDNPDALIRVSDPLPGSIALFQFIRPYFQEADFSSLNFETPVVLDPSTAHQQKDYAYFSLPGSMPALNQLGVDYLCTGNNHVYDYLEPGLKATLDYIAGTGIPHSGAGFTLAEAYKAHRVTLKGSGYGFLSMTSISGRKHDISYVADEVKGGAADLTRGDEVKTAVSGEIAAGYIPILQLHGGTEYAYEPTDYIAGAFQRLSTLGAALIVGHHPHTAQGVSFENGIPTIHSLGNFAFDQDRLETLVGILARVDMKGEQVTRLRILPVYLEDYRPRPITGFLADMVLRRLCQYSGTGAVIFPYHSRARLELNGAARQNHRSVTASITVPRSGVYVVDLREWAGPGESLARLEYGGNVDTVRVGRDIMMYGDFEDYDTDAETLDAARWDVTNESVFVSMSRKYRGVAGVSSIRSALNGSDSVVPFRNRIRVLGNAVNQPNKALSFFGYIQGETSGPIRVMARFSASEGDLQFGDEEVYSHPGGTFSWQPMMGDIHMPEDDPDNAEDPALNARAVRIFLRHTPPVSGSGIVSYDEMAVVNWEETISSGASLKTPHVRDFLRIRATPGQAQLKFTFVSFKPMVL